MIEISLDEIGRIFGIKEPTLIDVVRFGISFDKLKQAGLIELVLKDNRTYWRWTEKALKQ